MSINLGQEGQAGDLSVSGTLAGGSIYHGLNAEQLKALMAQQTEFYMTLVGAYERQHKELSDKLQRLRDENDMYRAGERAVREARQRALDQRLLLLAGSVAALAAALAAVAVRRRKGMAL